MLTHHFFSITETNMKNFVLLLAMATLASGESCSLRGDCRACLVDTRCNFVLAETAEQQQHYTCMDTNVSGKNMTILLRYRNIGDCEDTEQLITEDTVNQYSGTETEMMTAKEDIKCPIATPLMIAFVISLLLLAIVLSSVVTFACWVSVCGPEDGQIAYHH